MPFTKLMNNAIDAASTRVQHAIERKKSVLSLRVRGATWSLVGWLGIGLCAGGVILSLLAAGTVAVATEHGVITALLALSGVFAVLTIVVAAAMKIVSRSIARRVEVASSPEPADPRLAASEQSSSSLSGLPENRPGAGAEAASQSPLTTPAPETAKRHVMTVRREAIRRHRMHAAGRKFAESMLERPAVPAATLAASAAAVVMVGPARVARLAIRGAATASAILSSSSRSARSRTTTRRG